MIDIEAFAKTIGHTEALKRKLSNASYLQEMVRSGFPYRPFETVLNRLGLSRAQVSTALGLPERTMARRKKEGKFQARESESIFRFLRIAVHAFDTLQSDKNAAAWLTTPNRALAAAIPLDLLDTELGAGQVDEVLYRIDHGIYS